MDENTILYLGVTSFMALLVLASAGLYGSAGLIIIILSLVTILLILMINYTDFLLFPLLTRILRVKIIPAKDYYIPPSNDCVLKHTGGIYYATGYITANVYNYIFSAERIQEGEEAKLAEAPNVWERIVMSISFPFRFHIVAIGEELQTYRDDLEGKRGLIEFQMSREMGSSNPSQLSIQDYQRRIAILQARIDRLSAGEKPVNSIMYAETTAVGISEKEAMDALGNQVDHLQTVFSGFDVGMTRIVGREMYLLFGFNYALPRENVLTQNFSTEK